MLAWSTSVGFVDGGGVGREWVDHQIARGPNVGLVCCLGGDWEEEAEVTAP